MFLSLIGNEILSSLVTIALVLAFLSLIGNEIRLTKFSLYDFDTVFLSLIGNEIQFSNLATIAVVLVSIPYRE